MMLCMLRVRATFFPQINQARRGTDKHTDLIGLPVCPDQPRAGCEYFSRLNTLSRWLVSFSHRSFVLKEIQLWDLNTVRMTRKFTGQRQGKDIIRSCFGGAEHTFVVSGSEGMSPGNPYTSAASTDSRFLFLLLPPLFFPRIQSRTDGCVYVWHRDTGALLEILKGHGRGSVNQVAWHPLEPRLFASCSDDRTVRVWEPPPADLDVEVSYPEEPVPSPLPQLVMSAEKQRRSTDKRRISLSPSPGDIAESPIPRTQSLSPGPPSPAMS
jgi:WD40 repeat protein